MDFSLLTYNTLFSDAVSNIKKVVDRQHPDIVCLQEIDTTEETFQKVERLGYRLADYSNAFIKFGRIFGVATFYNPDVFEFRESKIIFLPKGIIEILVYLLRIFRTGKKGRTVLKTELVCKKTGQQVSVYNVHLSAHGTNSIRSKQIQIMLKDVGLSDSDSDESVILTGDFNYPFGRKKLESMMQTYSFREATNTIFVTMEGELKHYTLIEKILGSIFFKIMRHKLKLDYIFYRNCSALHAKTIDVDYSDHFPVFAVFKLPKR